MFVKMGLPSHSRLEELVEDTSSTFFSLNLSLRNSDIVNKVEVLPQPHPPSFQLLIDDQSEASGVAREKVFVP